MCTHKSEMASSPWFLRLKVFHQKTGSIPRMQTNAAKEQAEKIKTATETLTRLSQYKKEGASSLRSTTQEVAETKKLWREGNKSKLIQIGMALIVFPEPTPISEIIGAGFVAAGAVQKGIQNRALFMEDIGKTFKNTLKEIINTKYDLQV